MEYDLFRYHPITSINSTNKSFQIIFRNIASVIKTVNVCYHVTLTNVEDNWKIIWNLCLQKTLVFLKRKVLHSWRKKKKTYSITYSKQLLGIHISHAIILEKNFIILKILFWVRKQLTDVEKCKTKMQQHSARACVREFV